MSFLICKCHSYRRIFSHEFWNTVFHYLNFFFPLAGVAYPGSAWCSVGVSYRVSVWGGQCFFLWNLWWLKDGECNYYDKHLGGPDWLSQLYYLFREMCKWVKANAFRNQHRDIKHNAGADIRCLCNTNKKSSGPSRDFRLLVSQLPG